MRSAEHCAVEPVASASALASAVATSVQQSNARRDGRGGSIPAVGGPGGAFGDVFAESRRLVDSPQATGGGGQDAREWSGVGQQSWETMTSYKKIMINYETVRISGNKYVFHGAVF